MHVQTHAHVRMYVRMYVCIYLCIHMPRICMPEFSSWCSHLFALDRTPDSVLNTAGSECSHQSITRVRWIGQRTSSPSPWEFQACWASTSCSMVFYRLCTYAYPCIHPTIIFSYTYPCIYRQIYMIMSAGSTTVSESLVIMGAGDPRLLSTHRQGA